MNNIDEVNKNIDKAITRVQALILSANSPATTEVYLLQDLLTAKAFLNANIEVIKETSTYPEKMKFAKLARKYKSKLKEL